VFLLFEGTGQEEEEEVSFKFLFILADDADVVVDAKSFCNLQSLRKLNSRKN